MKRVLVPALLVALAACAPEEVMQPQLPAGPAPAPPSPVAAVPPPVRVTPDAPFRASPPPGGPAVVFVPPTVRELHLSSGVRVLLVERHDLPIVAVRVVADGGAGDLPWEVPGGASMMGAMLEQGTTTRSALQVSDAYEALGATHQAWVDWDSGGAFMKVTTDKLEPGLAVLADVVLHPTFPEGELGRLRARRLAALQQERVSPQMMTSNATAAALYGRAHPYGHSLSGQAADVAKITRDDLLRAHAVLFDPARTSIVVAGDVTPEALVRSLNTAFAGWSHMQAPPLTGHPGLKTVTPGLPKLAKGEPRLVIVDKPGAPQSVVRFADVGIAMNAPDRDAVLVMNEIYGGMFSSRINLNLREAHAYTYGAFSMFDRRHGAGPFVASANVKADTTAASISELFKETQAMIEKPVSAEELAGAKQSILLAMPARFESVDSITRSLADIVLFNLPLDEFKIRPALIEKVTAADVQKAAKAHLHPKSLRVIVVGDRAKLTPSLEPLHLGPVELRDASGDVVAHP